MSILTSEIILKIFPYAKNCPLGLDNLVGELNNAISGLGLGQYRLPMFLAQIGEESQQFTHFSENLNYSADSLVKVFPKYFPTLDVAMQYERQPEKIANKIYANRMGNGSEDSGDGWKYRGRGAIQITGKYNYQVCAKFLNVDCVGTPDYLSMLPGAVESAMWFWNMRGINKYADLQAVSAVTKLINGGVIGLPQRIANYNLAKQLLSIT
jgi:putative chitinase